MHNRITGFIIYFLFFYSIIILSCVTHQTPLLIENSLQQSELAYYCDSFDSFKEDLWEKAGYVFTATQLHNIRTAHMTIEEGRLRIDTSTGGFSKGGLVSKFALRGDFDVQVDFQLQFVSGEFDMDQLLGFGATEKTKSGNSRRLTSIGLHKKGKNNSGILSGYLEWGKYHSGYWHDIGNFTGSVKFVRIGSQISTFYRKKGQTRWIKMCTLPSAQNDTLVGFSLQNFTKDRNTIRANRSISAWIDNFTINAAQEIIESEI